MTGEGAQLREQLTTALEQLTAAGVDFNGTGVNDYDFVSADWFSELYSPKIQTPAIDFLFAAACNASFIQEGEKHYFIARGRRMKVVQP